MVGGSEQDRDASPRRIFLVVGAVFAIGDSLREERRRRKLDLSDVAAETRIRVSHLEALEQEQFDLLPPGLYRRSFLREYADFLGLDGEAFVQEYDLQFVRPEAEPLRPTPPTGSHPAGARIMGRRPLFRVAAFAALVVVGLGIWLLNRGGGPATVAPPSAATAPAVKGPTHTARHHGVTSAPPKLQPQATLTLTATRGSCWLQVQLGNAVGRTLYQQTLEPGQSAHFGLRQPLFIRLGAPWNIDAAIGHRSITAALPRHTGNILATASGLKPAH
jgi:transcriptional regulator with XRE-family HTH domain